jgi:hypothetical protein
LEQDRYEAQRAQRQYDLSDPENRLVTSELEKRWNEALEQIAESENELARIRVENKPLNEEQVLQLKRLGEDFSQAWNHPEVSIEIKKRIVRIVIEEIVVSKQEETMRLMIHWKGGDHTELTCPRKRSGSKTDDRVLEILEELRGVLTNEALAKVLNDEKLTTGTGRMWTPKRVQTFASKKLRSLRDNKEKLTVEQAAHHLGISAQELRKLTAQQKLKAHRVCASAPLLVDACVLETPTTKRAIAALKENRAFQQDLDL